MNAHELATAIAARLESQSDELKREFAQPDRIPSMVVDDLLPAETAHSIAAAFPKAGQLTRNKSLRERKSIGVQMHDYHDLCAEITYAFQDQRVIDVISEITSLPGLEGDPKLYAGGLSSMGQGDFLNPHLDNSHDHERDRYRALNLLYYVSPGWQHDNGGNLELWDEGVEGPARTIDSLFNRLAIMATGRRSWHSVSPVTADARRNCVSNYYFSQEPIERGHTYFHPTTFRGRPNQPVRDSVLRLDGLARHALRKVFRSGVRKTKHVYEPTRSK